MLKTGLSRLAIVCMALTAFLCACVYALSTANINYDTFEGMNGMLTWYDYRALLWVPVAIGTFIDILLITLALYTWITDGR